MARECTVTCNKCKQKLNKTEAVKEKETSKGYFHQECLEEKIKEDLKKKEKSYSKKYTCPVCNSLVEEDDPDKELVSGIYHHGHCYQYKKADNYGREELIDYIDKLNKRFGYTFTGKMFALIKKYHCDPDYNFNYKGMQLTLEYYIEILGNNYTDTTLGLIPYYYDETKEYEKKKRDNKKYIKSLDNIPLVTERTIVIPSPKLHNRLKERIEPFDPNDPALNLKEGEDGLVDDSEVIKALKKEKGIE